MGNDLFNLVKDAKLNGQTSFWGKYEHLNNVPTVSNTALFNYQISKLKALENSNANLIRANEILNEFSSVSAVDLQGQTIELSTNQIYARILEILNSAFISSPSSVVNRHLELKEGNTRRTYKAGHNKDTLQADKNSLIAELDALLQIIKYPNKDQVLLNFSKGLNGKKGFGKFSNYMQYKASEAENLMMHALSQSSSSWQAIVSGQFLNKGQQLIEDGFVFDSGLDFNIKFHSNCQATIISKNGNKTTKNVSSLQDFFNLLNGLSTNAQVSLNDELYTKLQELSVLRSQSKSGFGIQELINATAKRGSLSFNDTGYPGAIKSIYELYQKGWIGNSEGDGSKTLEGLSNYCLSKAIALTTLMSNDIYFTRDGFISASQWMQTYNYMLKFNPSINKVTNNFLDNKNPYRLAPVD